MSNSIILSVATKKHFYERTVLSLLSKMPLGRLNLTLPGGEELTFGDGRDNIVANIFIRDNYFFKHCLLFGDVGFGEAYVNGYWETDNISQVIQWFLLNIDNAPSVSGSRAKAFMLNI